MEGQLPWKDSSHGRAAAMAAFFFFNLPLTRIETVPLLLSYVVTVCTILRNLLDPSATTHCNPAIFYRILDSAYAHL